MSIYFFLFFTFFLMLYALLTGLFTIVREGFWGYHERILARITKYGTDTDLFGRDDMLINALKKQQKELEDIMGQYVFFRFCERLSVYFTQVDMAILFCMSLATVIFAHSAYVNREFGWLIIGLIAYGSYLWYELSGVFIKFEIWATNLFLKQYKVLNRSGSAENIVDAKKENKSTIRKLYLFFILPVSLLSLWALSVFIIYPLLPEMPSDLQAAILKLWMWFILGGGIFVAAIPFFLDKVLNAKIKFTKDQLSGSYYAVPTYLFLSLLMAGIISVSKYLI